MKKLLLFVFLISSLNISHAFEGEQPGLNVGEQAPDFIVSTEDGMDDFFSDIYHYGKVILIFYRGGWCYYCNLQIESYQKYLIENPEASVPIIAVSVDTAEKAQETKNTKGENITFVSNPSAEILRKYNAIYEVSKELQKMYLEKYNIDLKAYSGREDGIIAVPATYVVDDNGKILFAHSDVDYKVRPDIHEVFKHIEN